MFKLGEIQSVVMIKLGDATVMCTIYKNKICARIVCEECANSENVKEFEKPMSIKMKPVEGRIFREEKVFAKIKIVMRVLNMLTTYFQKLHICSEI